MKRRRLTFTLMPPIAAFALAGCGLKMRMVKPEPTLVPDSAVPRIDVDIAYDEVRTGRAVLIDVRGDAAWQSRHAAGALSIPLDDIEAAPAKAFAGVPADRHPILYCT